MDLQCFANNSPHHFGFSKSSKNTWTTHLQTIHPTGFRFFCKGWNSLSAGLVKQIVFPKNLRRRFFFSQAFKKKVQGGTLRTYGQVGMEWPVGGFHGFKTFEKLKKWRDFPSSQSGSMMFAIGFMHDGITMAQV